MGPVSRFGLGSYQGRTSLRTNLTDLLFTDFDLSPADFHGGYFPYILRTPTAGQIFRVGDAAGQCLPLTAEGIRPALYFGVAAGRLVRRVLDDELPLGQALSLYSGFVIEHRVYYDLLLALQNWLTRLPVRLTEAATRLVHWPRVLRPVMRAYWRAFEPEALAPTEEDVEMTQRFSQRKRHRLAV